MGTPLVLTQQIDSTTWQALGLTLTLIGLLVSAVVWRRSGAGRGLRVAGWSLVPLAAALTGVLQLLWEVVDAVLGWALGLVFSPIVWVGLSVAVVALVLHVAGGVLVRRESHRQSGRSDRGRGQDRQPQGGAGRGPRQEVLEDQDDIEAILRRHGIE